MKKKIWVPIVIVVLLALLFIPIPSGVYKDGGTREYTALTYKVVDWNRMVGADSIYDATRVYFLPNNFKSIDSLWYYEEDKVEFSFVATILEMNGSVVCVEPVEGEEERLSSDKITFDAQYLGDIGAEVGSVVQVTYTGGIMESYPAQIRAKSWKIADDLRHMEYKPVIYLYPEEETNVSVKLNLDGQLTCTYPVYEGGWKVLASPDGTLKDGNGQTYNYLYWEGETLTQYDLSKGFCVKGADTAVFLEDALEKLGLTRKEANEFIVYWLPLMEQNPYNIISFQSDIYTDAAQLEIVPAPDTVIRVFMAWQACEEYVELPEQELNAPERNGFVVIEWGGTEIE